MERQLTPRQYDILACYAETGLQKEVARRLGLSTQTVKNQMRRAYCRNNVESAVELYSRLGWLSVPER